MTRMKSNGDKGKPYRIPQEVEKNFDGVPLIRTTKLVEVRQPIIQLTARRGAPINLVAAPINPISSHLVIVIPMMRSRA